MTEPTIITASDFGRLFTEYRDRFIAIAESYIHDSSVAEDIVSDVFTKLWDMRGRLSLHSSPLPVYIYSMVRNSCLNYLRDTARHKNILDNLLKEDILSLESREASSIMNDEVRQLVDRFMASIPADRREIFAASRFEGLSHNEIAVKYGYTPRKIRREIGKALEELRELLKSYL